MQASGLAGGAGHHSPWWVISDESLRGGRTIYHQLRPVGFQVTFHAVDPADLDPSHLVQVPEHLVMDQHLAKVHDPNVALFRPPELPLGQCR